MTKYDAESVMLDFVSKASAAHIKAGILKILCTDVRFTTMIVFFKHPFAIKIGLNLFYPE